MSLQKPGHRAVLVARSAAAAVVASLVPDHVPAAGDGILLFARLTSVESNL